MKPNKEKTSGRLPRCRAAIAGIGIGLAALCVLSCGLWKTGTAADTTRPETQIETLAQPVVAAFAQEWRPKPLPAPKNLLNTERPTEVKKAFSKPFTPSPWEISSPIIYFGLILPPLPPPASA